MDEASSNRRYANTNNGRMKLTPDHSQNNSLVFVNTPDNNTSSAQSLKQKFVHKNIKLQPIDKSLEKIPEKKVIQTATQKRQLLNNQISSPAKLMTSGSILNNRSIEKIKEQESIENDYKLGNFAMAVDFFKQNSYMKKRTIGDHVEYEDLEVIENNDEFKEFNLGVYFYLELMKQMIVTFLLMSILAVISMIYNYQGTGLSTYPSSFSITLAGLSLGNNTYNSESQMLTQIFLDCAYSLMFIIFFVHWRRFTYSTIVEYEENSSILDPQKFVLSVVGFDSNNGHQLGERIKQHMYQRGFPLYQCSIVYDYNRQFQDFVDLEEIIEKIHTEEALIKQESGDKERLVKLSIQKSELETKLVQKRYKPIPMYAIIHFQHISQRERFVSLAESKGLFNRFKSHMYRKLCCVNFQSHQIFEGKDLLLVDQLRLGKPEDIYWENLDIGFCNRFFRIVIGLILLVICLLITSSSIAVCTLYVNSSSSCVNYNSSTTLAQAQANDNLLFCYCQSNLISTFGSSDISVACANLKTIIIVTNGLQVAASLVSSITNIILNVFIVLIVAFMKPPTKSTASSTIFIVMFIATVINSCLLPLVLNASIFGYNPNNYITFISFINFSKVIAFSDFNKAWYAYISPYYVNMFLVAIVMPWLDLLKVFILRKCFKERSLRNNQGSLLQKEMNRTMTDFMFDLSSENAILMLNTFMCLTYCSSVPLLLLLHLAGLCSNYICKKKILITFSKRVPAGEDLNNYIINLMPLMMLFHIGFGIWAYTCPQIFSTGVFGDFISLKFRYFNSDLDRIFYIIPMIGIFAVIVVFLIFDYSIISIFKATVNCLCGDKNIIHPETRGQPSFEERYKTVNILGSYQIRKNPEYKHAVNVMTNIIRKTEYKQLPNESFATADNNELAHSGIIPNESALQFNHLGQSLNELNSIKPIRP